MANRPGITEASQRAQERVRATVTTPRSSMAKDYVFDAARFAGERSDPDTHTYLVEIHQAGETVFTNRVDALSVEGALSATRQRLDSLSLEDRKRLVGDAPYEIQISRRFKIVPKVVHIVVDTEEVT